MKSLTIGLSLAAAAILPSAFANTQNDVIDGQTDLTLAATYSGGGPLVTDDVTWIASPYTAPAFTLNNPGAISVGTLNSLSTTAITISNAIAATYGTLTLNGGSNSVAVANGGTANDVLFVKTGSSLTLAGTETSGIALQLGGVTGVFNIEGTAAINGSLSGTGGLTKTGAGTLTLGNSYNSAFTGTININAGRLLVGSGPNANNATNGQPIMLGDTTGAAGATFSVNRNRNYNSNIVVNAGSSGVKRISGGPALGINQQPGIAATVTLNDALTIGNGVGGDVGGVGFAGVITGSSTITIDGGKEGTPTFDGAGSLANLSANNSLTLTSTINVSRGGLRLTTGGAGGTGTINVNGAAGSASISGNGTAFGSVVVTNGNSVAPGNNTNAIGTGLNGQVTVASALGTGGGTLGLGIGTGNSLNLSNGSHIFFDLAATNVTGNDRINTDLLVMGTLTFHFNGLDLTGLITADGVTTYTLISSINAPTGFNAANISTEFIGTLAGKGYVATYSVDGSNALVATFVAVPEPGTIALLMGGAGLLFVLKRKRLATVS